MTKMFRLVFFGFLLGGVQAIGWGQAMTMDGGGSLYLYKNEKSDENASLKRGYYVGPHILGDTVTMLLNAFEKEYVFYKKTVGAYASEERSVIKRDIYKAIKQLNSYYMKEFKKGRLTQVVASERLKQILNIGIKLKNYNTIQVETDLKKKKVPSEIENYFLSLKFV